MTNPRTPSRSHFPQPGLAATLAVLALAAMQCQSNSGGKGNGGQGGADNEGGAGDASGGDAQGGLSMRIIAGTFRGRPLAAPRQPVRQTRQ